MTIPRLTALAWLLAAPLAAQDLAGQAVSSVPFTDRGLLVWQGRDAISLAELAGLVAPVLWFSPDEPLLLNGGRLPHGHPCDGDADSGVVYYQVRRIRLRGESRVTVPEHDDTDFFDKVDSFAIRFYFYYERDFGVGSHAHDLELVEMELSLSTDATGRREARLSRVTGFAHGTDWYSNELHIEADTRLPITVIVEEGKHASSPDRNADGIYTPGYDVNRRINDAWGIRDVLGSGFITAGAFQASMAKPRRPADRRAPPPGRGRSAVVNSVVARPPRRGDRTIPVAVGGHRADLFIQWTGTRTTPATDVGPPLRLRSSRRSISARAVARGSFAGRAAHQHTQGRRRRHHA